jgi:uncharacterized protein HemX
MGKETNEKNSRLKLVHLLWLILIVAVGVGVSWGVVANQQSVNSKEIEKKLDRELFEMHQVQQTKQFESLERSLKEGFDRIDKQLDKIE